MFGSIKRVYDWMGTQVYSPYAKPMLALIFILKQFFLFLPIQCSLCIALNDAIKLIGMQRLQRYLQFLVDSPGIAWI